MIPDQVGAGHRVVDTLRDPAFWILAVAFGIAIGVVANFLTGGIQTTLIRRKKRLDERRAAEAELEAQRAYEHATTLEAAIRDAELRHHHEFEYLTLLIFSEAKYTRDFLYISVTSWGLSIMLLELASLGISRIPTVGLSALAALAGGAVYGLLVNFVRTTRFRRSIYVALDELAEVRVAAMSTHEYGTIRRNGPIESALE